ncbi:MAG TPA: LysR family transcriptional regulator, partial [Haliangiales bacterium]|nr:LysR family transcriptional regulator [Haliangiales bacterium]
MDDPFDGVTAFVQVAGAKSFTDAARRLGVTASALSKTIARLEAGIGARLLHRSARGVTPTSEGEEFLARCRRAVDELRAGRDALAERAPRGPLRASLPHPLGRMVVMPALSRLLLAHPGLELRVSFTDRYVRFAEENVDVAIRIGVLADQSATAQRLRTLRWVTAAAPAYLKRRGTPGAPAALAGHDCLRFILPSGLLQTWRFAGGRLVAVRGNLTADLGEGLVEAAAAGLGIIQAHDYMVAPAIAAGRLVPILA